MAIEKHHMPVDGVWRDCPSCGHQDGWHVFFKRANDPKVAYMHLLCPNCKNTFDLGLQLQLS